jgi:hypothetical protein
MGKNFLLHMWANGYVKVVLYLEQCESLARHAHEKLGHFRVEQTYNFILITILVAKDVIITLTNFL